MTNMGKTDEFFNWAKRKEIFTIDEATKSLSFTESYIRTMMTRMIYSGEAVPVENTYRPRYYKIIVSKRRFRETKECKIIAWIERQSAPVTISEIIKHFKFQRSDTIGSTMNRLYMQGRVKRTKNENGRYTYAAYS